MNSSFYTSKTNFPESDIFTNLDSILYVGCGYDNNGLEDLVKKHREVIGIDLRLCDRLKDIKEREELCGKYSNLFIKEMDARKLDFSNGYFNGVIFKRSLAFIGSDRKIKNEKDIKKALNETNRVLCKEGLVWIIYSAADIEELTIDRINILLESTRFKIIEDKEYGMVCKKV